MGNPRVRKWSPGIAVSRVPSTRFSGIQRPVAGTVGCCGTEDVRTIRTTLGSPQRDRRVRATGARRVRSSTTPDHLTAAPLDTYCQPVAGGSHSGSGCNRRPYVGPCGARRYVAVPAEVPSTPRLHHFAIRRRNRQFFQTEAGDKTAAVLREPPAERPRSAGIRRPTSARCCSGSAPRPTSPSSRRTAGSSNSPRTSLTTTTTPSAGCAITSPQRSSVTATQPQQKSYVPGAYFTRQSRLGGMLSYHQRRAS